MNDTKIKMIGILINQDLKVDTVGSIIDRDKIDGMIQVAEAHRLQLCDDYEVLKTPQVKEILMEHYNRINANIRTLKFVKNHHLDVIPVWERLGN